MIGHIHAESMAQYAEDAKTHEEPHLLWEFLTLKGDWEQLEYNPGWVNTVQYRRKPQTNEGVS